MSFLIFNLSSFLLLLVAILNSISLKWTGCLVLLAVRAVCLRVFASIALFGDLIWYGHLFWTLSGAKWHTAVAYSKQDVENMCVVSSSVLWCIFGGGDGWIPLTWLTYLPSTLFFFCLSLFLFFTLLLLFSRLRLMTHIIRKCDGKQNEWAKLYSFLCTMRLLAICCCLLLLRGLRQ